MKRIVFTDLDGTLLNSNWVLSERNRETLRLLGDKGIVRVVVTGRSLYSTRKLLQEDFPIDYLIFSTGAGIADWLTGHIIRSNAIDEDYVREYVEILLDQQINFMLHREIPESHFFYYYEGDHTPDDFQQRIEIYSQFAVPFSFEEHAVQPATQFLSVLTPVKFEEVYTALRELKLNLSLIKTTSPLLKSSLWLETYAEGVSKGEATAFLAGMHDATPGDCMVIGNDFNDQDMLEWSENSYVVGNAPDVLKQRFQTVADNDNDGFSQAVEDWLERISTE